MSKAQLSLATIANPGDTLPPVPVYDWTRDPQENPTAFVNAMLANWSYYLGTQDDGNAEYAIETITDDPSMVQSPADSRNLWHTNHPAELPWFWGDNVTFTSTKDSDGTLTISVRARIYAEAFASDPDVDGWKIPGALDETAATKMSSVDVILSHWITTHPDIEPLESLTKVLVGGNGSDGLPLPN